MAPQSFDAFFAQVMQLFQAQAYGDASTLLTEQGDHYPDQASTVLYLHSCLAARMQQPDVAVHILQAAADRGFWYSENVMRNSPSYQPLQGQPAFEALVTIFSARHAAVPREPRRIVLEPEGAYCSNRPCPLFLALHGNGDNATNALDAWRSVVDDGWMLAALQSSQIATMDGFVWDDQEVARQEIEAHYHTLQTDYTLDAEQVIIAGFSMGGAIALRLALDGPFPVPGFILLGPGGPPMESVEHWTPLIEQAAARGLRGYVIVGEADTGIPHAVIRTIVEELNAHGIACELETLPGIGHTYPPDMAPIIRRALAFIQHVDKRA